MASKNVTTAEMMQDVAKATEMTWGVECSIQQCPDKMAWDILVSAYNPFDMLIYAQKEIVTDFTLKSSKMPEYIFMVIADMVKKLQDSIFKAQPMKAGIADETFHKPFPWEHATTASAPVFQPKYYSAPIEAAPPTTAPPPSTPWEVFAPSKLTHESTYEPVKSLKEMYEQDSAKKVKKVKKPKLTAAELVKQKEAQKSAAEMPPLTPEQTKMISEFIFADDPLLKYLKDKNQAAQGGAQIQSNLSYKYGVIGENAEQKALQEAQKVTYEELEKVYFESIAATTQADTEKVVAELKHKAECPNKTKK